MKINNYITQKKHRLFKIKLKDKDKTLWRTLDYWGFIKYQPTGKEVDFYYSSAIYRTPITEREKDEKFLYSDLVIDCDGTPQDNNLKLIKFIESKGYKRVYILETKPAHYQILFKDKKPPIKYKLPQERLNWYKAYRKKLIKQIGEEGLICDFSVIRNPHQVVRIPESERRL